MVEEMRDCFVDSQVPQIKKGDIFTIGGVGENPSGDMIQRLRNDNPDPPFWGVNQRTGKRGKATKLMQFRAKDP